MPYIVPADFRVSTITAWTNGLDLTTVEASDADLTAAIAEAQNEVDLDLDDHFETETGTTLQLTGPRSTRLYLPKRTQSVTSVGRRNSDGTYTTQGSTTYFLVSSISGSTVDVRKRDFLVTNVPGFWFGGWSYWPGGPAEVQVIGNFGWPTTPTAIKRLTAIYVWKRFKAFDSYQDAASPVGEGEIAEIIHRFHRPEFVVA